MYANTSMPAIKKTCCECEEKWTLYMGGIGRRGEQGA